MDTLQRVRFNKNIVRILLHVARVKLSFRLCFVVVIFRLFRQ